VGGRAIDCCTRRRYVRLARLVSCFSLGKSGRPHASWPTRSRINPPSLPSVYRQPPETVLISSRFAIGRLHQERGRVCVKTNVNTSATSFLYEPGSPFFTKAAHRHWG